MPKKKKGFNLKEGAFTKQAKEHKMTIPAFAKYVIVNYKNPKTKYNPTTTTFRRANFYINSKFIFDKKKKI